MPHPVRSNRPQHKPPGHRHLRSGTPMQPERFSSSFTPGAFPASSLWNATFPGMAGQPLTRTTCASRQMTVQPCSARCHTCPSKNYAVCAKGSIAKSQGCLNFPSSTCTHLSLQQPYHLFKAMQHVPATVRVRILHTKQLPPTCRKGHTPTRRSLVP